MSLIILIIYLTIFTQTTAEVQHKYGPPFSESYLVRPNIIVTMKKSKSGEACELVVAPKPPDAPIKSSEARLKSDELNAIIDELVPKDKRGKLLMGTFLNLQWGPNYDCDGTSEDYKLLSIYRNGSKDAHRYAVIRWKNRSCQP